MTSTANTPKAFSTNGRKISVKVSRFLIDEAVHNLRDNGETFISNLDTVQAYRCRKRIAKALGNNSTVKAYPATSEDPETKQECDGYLFRLVNVNGNGGGGSKHS